MFCQGTQHCCNLIIAWKIGEYSGLECEWYIVNLMTDATLGVLFQYVYLKVVLNALNDTKYSFESGNYYSGHTFSLNEYFYQMTIWLFIVLLSKLTSFGIVLIFFTSFQSFGIFLLKDFKGNPKLKLVFVMIVIPMIFNTLQFWITDNFIQRHTISEDENPLLAEKSLLKSEQKDNENKSLLENKDEENNRIT
jgi:hypothetical protein